MNIVPAYSTKALELATSCSYRNSKKSTQKEVVSAVRAESVVAKVAAVNPSINTMAGINTQVF